VCSCSNVGSIDIAASASNASVKIQNLFLYFRLYLSLYWVDSFLLLWTACPYCWLYVGRIVFGSVRLQVVIWLIGQDFVSCLIFFRGILFDRFLYVVTECKPHIPHVLGSF
jgi:hypothetical protein